MDFSKILTKYYLYNSWSCGDTYETIEWYDTTRPKPTLEELESLWEELKKDNMRQERNRLLKDCDFRVLSDYPNTNKEAWLSYRQELRDFPSVWLPGMAFPEKPNKIDLKIRME
jgi:hypothetical protein